MNPFFKTEEETKEFVVVRKSIDGTYQQVLPETHGAHEIDGVYKAYCEMPDYEHTVKPVLYPPLSNVNVLYSVRLDMVCLVGVMAGKTLDLYRFEYSVQEYLKNGYIFSDKNKCSSLGMPVSNWEFLAWAMEQVDCDE